MVVLQATITAHGDRCLLNVEWHPALIYPRGRSFNNKKNATDTTLKSELVIASPCSRRSEKVKDSFYTILSQPYPPSGSTILCKRASVYVH